MTITQTWTEPSTLDRAVGELVSETQWTPAISNQFYIKLAAERAMNNKSGSDYTTGAVVVQDTSNDLGFTDTTTPGDSKVIGVLVHDIANDDGGYVAQTGLVTVLVQGNVSRGQYLQASATAGRAEGKSYLTPGTFAIATTAYAGGGTGSVDAIMMRARAGSWAVIYDSLLTGSVSGFDITNIPQNYKALKMYYSLRTSDGSGGGEDYLDINLNGNSSDFDYTRLIAIDTAITAVSSAGNAKWGLIPVASATSPAGDWAHGIIEFPNYASTSTYPTGLLTGGQLRSSTAAAAFKHYKMMCVNDTATEAISRITLGMNSGGNNFVAGSRITLLGLI